MRKAASVKTSPVPPNAAVVAKAGIYFGLFSFRKMLELTTPIMFAIGTATLVNKTRLFSFATLLSYSTSNKTLGADVPQVITKLAK